MIRTCLLMTCIVCTIVLKSIDTRVIDDVISVNQSQIPDGDNKNQKHKEFSRQPLLRPLPPLEVAPYRGLIGLIVR